MLGPVTGLLLRVFWEICPLKGTPLYCPIPSIVWLTRWRSGAFQWHYCNRPRPSPRLTVVLQNWNQHVKNECTVNIHLYLVICWFLFIHSSSSGSPSFFALLAKFGKLKFGIMPGGIGGNPGGIGGWLLSWGGRIGIDGGKPGGGTLAGNPWVGGKPGGIGTPPGGMEGGVIGGIPGIPGGITGGMPKFYQIFLTVG